LKKFFSETKMIIMFSTIAENKIIIFVSEKNFFNQFYFYFFVSLARRLYLAKLIFYSFGQIIKFFVT